MKKNIGKVLALYPTPLVVIGAFVNNKATYTLVAHIGIIGHDRLLVSLAKPHYINRGIKESKALSINIVDKAMLPKADYVGLVSGNRVDKSSVFEHVTAESGAPLIEESPLSIDCKVIENYETEAFDNFIVEFVGTHVDESVLDASGKIDYRKLKPVLFEFPTYEYLETGDVIAKCLSLGKDFK